MIVEKSILMTYDNKLFAWWCLMPCLPTCSVKEHTPAPMIQYIVHVAIGWVDIRGIRPKQSHDWLKMAHCPGFIDLMTAKWGEVCVQSAIWLTKDAFLYAIWMLIGGSKDCCEDIAPPNKPHNWQRPSFQQSTRCKESLVKNLNAAHGTWPTRFPKAQAHMPM